MSEPRPEGPSSISFEEYVALDGENWHRLRHLAMSPAHYIAARNTPSGQDSDPLRLGRAAHTLLFEPDEFHKRYSCYSERRGTKAYDAFERAFPNRTILKDKQVDKAVAMVTAVLAHPAALAYLEPRGKAEQTLVWTDEETGIVCKARPDYLSRWHAIVDLKTTSNLAERQFATRAVQLGYPQQLAHYRDGALASGVWATPPACVLIVVEDKPPFDVGVFELDSEALAFGSEQVHKLLRQLKECRRSDLWPGRYPNKQAFALPEWAKQNPDIFVSDEEVQDG